MNKIKNLLKVSPVIAIVASLAIVGLASAAIVSVLSNKSTAAVNITAPMETAICEGETATGCVGTAINVAATGLSTVKFVTIAKNLANNSVEGYRVIVLEAPENEILTGKELTSMKIRFESDEANEYSVLGMLYAVGSTGTLYPLSGMTSWPYGKMIIVFSRTGSADKSTYEVGSALNWNKFQATLGNITGTYNITTEMVYNLADYAAEQYATN